MGGRKRIKVDKRGRKKWTQGVDGRNGRTEEKEEKWRKKKKKNKGKKGGRQEGIKHTLSSVKIKSLEK